MQKTIDSILLFLEKYFGAYYVSMAYNMNRVSVIHIF